MTDKKKIIKLVLVSTLTALPFFYFGEVVGFAALMLAVGFCLRSHIISGNARKLFWLAFLGFGFMGIGWTVLPLALVAFILDKSVMSSRAEPDGQGFDPWFALTPEELERNGYSSDFSLHTQLSSSTDLEDSLNNNS